MPNRWYWRDSDRCITDNATHTISKGRQTYRKCWSHACTLWHNHELTLAEDAESKRPLLSLSLFERINKGIIPESTTKTVLSILFMELNRAQYEIDQFKHKLAGFNSFRIYLFLYIRLFIKKLLTISSNNGQCSELAYLTCVLWCVECGVIISNAYNEAMPFHWTPEASKIRAVFTFCWFAYLEDTLLLNSEFVTDCSCGLQLLDWKCLWKYCKFTWVLPASRSEAHDVNEYKVNAARIFDSSG